MKQADQMNWSSLNQEQLVDLASSLNNFFNQTGLLNSQNQHSTGQCSVVLLATFFLSPSHTPPPHFIQRGWLTQKLSQDSIGQLILVLLSPDLLPPPPPLFQNIYKQS